VEIGSFLADECHIGEQKSAYSLQLLDSKHKKQVGGADGECVTPK